MNWTDNKLKFVLNLRKKGLSHSQIATECCKEFDEHVTRCAVINVLWRFEGSIKHAQVIEVLPSAPSPPMRYNKYLEARQ